MKIKLLLFFVLAMTVQGFSQEKVVEIQSQKEFFNSVTLTPQCGTGNEVVLPFSVFWEQKTGTVKVDFKSNKGTGKTLYCFPQKMTIKKEVMKLRKDVWFAKEVKKCQVKKTVNACIDAAQLVNAETLPSDSIQTLEFDNSNATMSFLFRRTGQDNADITIPFHFYIASKETKSKRTQKIEYETTFTLIIKRSGTSAPPKNTTPTTPKEENKPAVETVNCKTLHKANEQLTELLLDIKNSNSNLTPLKQKYETIKKSVANPEYKKCKEEYKVYESLCGKIDNRLK